MHHRISVHQVAMLGDSTTAFVEHCRSLGIRHTTLVTTLLGQPGGLEEAQAALAPGGVDCTTVNHVFGCFPNLPEDTGRAASELNRAIDIAAGVGAGQIYLISGGRGALDWESAAERFAELVAPCRDHGLSKGVLLLVENASALNVDIHMAHTLPDATRLAEMAGIGVCVEFHACWMEANLRANVRKALPLAGLVQVSDYVLGDRTTPCRAVPGDGVIPLERIIAELLEDGYEGLFDLELVGPRIVAEGPRSAIARSAERISQILTRLGA